MCYQEEETMQRHGIVSLNYWVTYTIWTLLRFPNSDGTGPLRLFLLKFLHQRKTITQLNISFHQKIRLMNSDFTHSSRRCSRSPIDSGIVPEKSLWERSLEDNAVEILTCRNDKFIMNILKGIQYTHNVSRLTIRPNSTGISPLKRFDEKFLKHSKVK